MKKLLLLLIIFKFQLSSFNCSAQTSVYHPFPDSDAVWMGTNWWCDDVGCYDHDYILFIAGDTVIGGNHYRKLLSTGYDCLAWDTTGGSAVNKFFNRPSGAFREDTALRKVYYVPKDSSNESLLYDFNLSVGDTLPLAYNNWDTTITVTSIDSILMGSDYRKRFWLSIPSFNLPTGYGSLIEGMGSTFGFYDRIVTPFESGNYLNCFTVNGQTIFLDSTGHCIHTLGISEINKNSSLLISPNPAHNKLNVECKLLNAELRIYDMMGRKVMNAEIGNSKLEIGIDFPPGIYFVRVSDGQNAVVQKLIIE
jgi:hypothetical protein